MDLSAFKSFAAAVGFFAGLSLFSCMENGHEGPRNSRTVTAITTQGHVILSDSIKPPVIVPVKEENIRTLTAGKPTVIPINRNVRAAVPPTPITAGAPKVCIPGENTYRLSRPVVAKGKVVAAGQPEMIPAGSMLLQEQAPRLFRHFSRDLGMDFSKVNCIREDRSGGLWFCTSGNGVFLYDGKSFTRFTSAQGLGSDDVTGVLEDRNGNLWFSTWGGGVNRYDGRSFTRFTEADGFSNDRVNCMLEDRQGNIWFGTWGGGATRYDGKTFTSFTTLHGLSHDVVHAIAQDLSGNLWFATSKGVTRFDGKTFVQYSAAEGLGHDNVTCILEDRSGKLWFGTEGGAVQFDGTSFRRYTRAEGLNGDDVKSIVQDRVGNIWFGTREGGASRYDGTSFTDFTVSEGLGSAFVKCMLEDRSGTIWISAWDSDVVRYDGNTFTHYSRAEGLPSDHVTAICRDRNGKMWFGTWGGGVVVHDGASFSHLTTSQGLNNNYVKCILQDRNGNLWFGTWGGGVSRYDGKTFRHYTTADGLSHDVVFDITEDSNGNIWFGTWGGATRYDGTSFSQYTTAQGLSNDMVYDVLQDRSGTLWFATGGGGVTGFDGKTFTHITTAEGLVNDVVYELLEDKQGNLWFATGGGLTRFDGNTLVAIHRSQGLTDDVVTGLAEDVKAGELWFGTRSGLFHADENRLNRLLQGTDTVNAGEYDTFIKSIGHRDGFLGKGCEDRSLFLASDGLLWVGSSNLLSSIKTRAIFKDTIAPDMRLTGLELFNERVNWRSTIEKRDTSILLENGVSLSRFRFDSLSKCYGIPEGLSLRHNNNYINFNFVGVTTHQTEKVRYRYKLEGLDEDWSAVTDRAQAPYGNIPSGTYVFKVKARNGDGKWSEEYPYRFTIRPPWWKTPVAYGSYAVLIVLSYAGAIRWNSYRLRKRTLLLKEAVDDATAQLRLQREWEVRKLQDENRKNIVKTQEDERVRIGRDLHDDLGARLSTLKLLLQSVFRKEGGGQEPIRESSISLLDSAISDMRGIITNLSPRSLRENGYLKAVEELVAGVSKSGEIRFELSMHGMDRRFDTEFENSLFRITQELVNNSLKYARATTISIGAVFRDGKVVLSYEDDGIGISPDKSGKGYGLNNIRSRAELYGGDFFIDPATGSGFACEVTLLPPA